LTGRALHEKLALFLAMNRWMMSQLDDLIAKAYASEGKQEDVNKVYLALLQTMLFVPVEKTELELTDLDEPFRPLFAKFEDKYFMLAFDSEERLSTWAGEEAGSMGYVEISGRDVIAGMGEEVFLGLNVGSDFYKQFSSDEVKQLKKIVARIDEMRNG
jgi:hypothetical protein